MILYSDDKNKFIGLIVLVVVAAGAIIWQWSNLTSWPSEHLNQDDPWQDIRSETSDAWKEFSLSFGLARDQVSNFQEELFKEQKKTQLLEFTRQYLSEQEQAE